MATQVLAAGTTAADSSDIVVADGSSTVVSLFGTLDTSVICPIKLITSGDPVVVGALTGASPALVLAGPATYRVSRPVTAKAVGVSTGA